MLVSLRRAVFAVVKDELYPRYILPQGDGNDAKGLKCEWMTVKDDKLLVGSIGKEWTTADGVRSAPIRACRRRV